MQLINDKEMEAVVKATLHKEDLKAIVLGNPYSLNIILTNLTYEISKRGGSVDDIVKAMNKGIHMARVEKEGAENNDSI